MGRLSRPAIGITPAALVVGLALTGINIGGVAIDQLGHQARSERIMKERAGMSAQIVGLSRQITTLSASVHECR